MALKEQYPGKWLTPDGRVSSKGFLYITKSGLCLKLIGIDGLDSPPNHKSSSEGLGKLSLIFSEPVDSRLEFDTLLSETIHGTIVSLFDLQLSFSKSNMFDDDYQNSYLELTPKYALFGDESLSDKNAAIFTSARVMTAELYKTTTGQRIVSERVGDEYWSSVHILKEGGSDSFRLDDGTEIKFYNGASQSNHSQGIKILEFANVIITPPRLSSFISLEALFFKLNLLLEFFQGEASNLLEFKLFTDKIEAQVGVTPIYQDFEILRRGGYDADVLPSQKRAIIKLIDISDTPDVLTKWMNNEGEIAKCLGWFLFIWQKGGYLVESQFVDLMSILEIMPLSEEKDITYVSKAEFELLEASLLSQLPNTLSLDADKAFRGAIENMNRKNNRALIGLAVIEFWNIISRNVKITSDEFSSVLIVNRNLISHGSKKTRKFQTRGPHSLYKLKEILKYLVYMVLASKLGISRDVIDRTIGETYGKLELALDANDFEKIK